MDVLLDAAAHNEFMDVDYDVPLKNHQRTSSYDSIEELFEDSSDVVAQPSGSKTRKRKGVDSVQVKKAKKPQEEPVKKKAKAGPPTRKKSIAKRPPSKKFTRKTAASASTASPQHSNPESSRQEFIPRPRHPQEGFSAASARRAYQKIAEKPALPERGFDNGSINRFKFISEVIEKHGWGNLCKVQKTYNITLTREFYAEAHMSKGSLIQVRGVQITLTSETINNLLGLTPPPVNQFKYLMDTATREKLDEIIVRLGKPGSEWKPHKNHMLQTFKSANLEANPNVWINFIRHSLSPTTHDHTITVERMILLHCVMEGLSINVGDVMLQSIRYSATRSQGKLYLPCLVNKLCVQAGVQQYEEDEIVEEGEDKHTIDVRSVERLQADKPVKSGSSGDLYVLINSLLDQNSSVMDGLMEQRKEFMAEVAELKENMQEELRKETKEMKEEIKALKSEVKKGNIIKKKGVAAKQKKMAAKIKTLRAQVKKLKEEKAAAVAAASKSTPDE